jgi:rRNA maturation endonuclease Nob1
MKKPMRPTLIIMNDVGFKIRCENCKKKFYELHLYKEKELCDDCLKLIQTE